MKLLPSLLTVAKVSADLYPMYLACTPQPPGNCNLGMEGVKLAWPDDYVGWYMIRIYDHSCNIIGGIDAESNRTDGYHPPVSVGSQLPYTVEITYFDNGQRKDDVNYFTFAYSTYSFTGDFACRLEDDYNGTHVCQHAFPC